MQNLLARVISYLLHPLLIPVYVLLLVLNTSDTSNLMIPFSYKITLFGMVALTAVLFPLFLTFLLFRFRLISSIYVDQREERVYLILAVAIFYYLTYYLLKGVSLSIIFNYFMLGSALLALVTLILNFYFKVSLHMIGVGSLCGLLLGISIKYGVRAEIPLYLSILASGITGFARLELNAHRPSEIYWGYFLGVTGMALMMLLR
ncbi:MAG TPA: hypothetical protein PKN12_05140 [Bacteroidales bacterium]|jgi:hypothetical protein|nr:hypothetical protein [Bacteroidales bacterium]HPT09472.1 hypothetical protein [Bacteroidales bacterium]